ncbi:MAG: lysophospholipase [Luteibaculum sp.]
MDQLNYLRIAGYKIAFEEVKADKPIARIIMVHGLGEHCWRYSHVVKYFIQNGVSVIRFDLPGHGLSSGKRGHIKSYKDVLAPIHHFVNQPQDLPTFIFGHSMGGNIVLGYLLLRQPQINGAIIASPWVALSFKPGFIKTVLAKIANRVLPSLIKKNDLSVYALSRDNEVVEAYEDDDLVHDWISPRLFVEMSKMATLIQLKARDINANTFLYHGKDDQITAHWATKLISEKMPNARFISYESGYHEMHNEPNKKEVFDNILSYIQERIKPEMA